MVEGYKCLIRKGLKVTRLVTEWRCSELLPLQIYREINKQPRVEQINERWQIWYCWPCTRCSEIWVTDMRGKLNSSTQELISSLLWKFLLNSEIQNVLYACTRMSGLRLRKPELPNFQGCQTVFEINVKRKRDFNVFLQIHVSIFCAEPSINILDRLSCFGLVFVIFTYILCHFYVSHCYMIPFKQIVFPKSKCLEPQLFCLFAKLLLFWEIF